MAVAYARRAVETNAMSFRSQIQLGSSLLRAGEGRSALDAFVRADALEPGNAHAKFCMGLGYEAVGDNDAAVDSLKAAIETNPDLVQYHHKLSLLQLNAGRLDEAEEAAGQCLARNELFSGSYYVIGRIHDARGNYPEALAAAEKAIELDGSVPAYENLRLGLRKKMGYG
jgi:tetratricopeptide (TPR) repeat protein